LRFCRACDLEVLSVLFPQLAGLLVERVFLAGKSVRIQARASALGAGCPACGAWSDRVHSRYERQLADLAAGGQETLVHLQVRRFFCRNRACSAVTFAEQVPALAARRARRTAGLTGTLEAIALALGGRAGARLTGRLASSASRSTLLRLIRALPDLPATSPRVLGVDDFALRRGHVYGTVLVDIETGRPVDLLAERSADSLESWLGSRPGVEVICRDRGGCYAEGAARGAPLAVQVADRWHLLHNLGEAVERAAARHRSCLRDEAAAPVTVPVGTAMARTAPAAPEGQRAQNTRDRHALVHAAVARGLTITQISRDLQLDRKTVRRYAAAADPAGMLADAPARQAGLLDPHLAYLHQRWEDGCHSTDQLHAELRARGYRGSLRTLRRRTATLRQGTATPARPPAPGSKKVAAWILTPPGRLTDEHRAALDAILARCPELAATRTLVRQFGDMLTHRQGSKLPGWAGQAEASDVPELRSFAAGLRKDWPAVTAGLTLPWSSGAVEGHVNRIKMIKRQMYGRARPDLLRKRVLLAD
jgi:transposase